MDPNDVDFILKLLRLAYEFQIHDNLWWREDNGLLRFFINCNDVFAWACADLEQVTPENIDILRQSCLDEQAATGKPYNIWGPMLFCARSRKERVQSAWYKDIDKELWPLFDAAGEYRPVDFGNPYEHPSKTEDGTAQYAYRDERVSGVPEDPTPES